MSKFDALGLGAGSLLPPSSLPVSGLVSARSGRTKVGWAWSRGGGYGKSDEYRLKEPAKSSGPDAGRGEKV